MAIFNTDSTKLRGTAAALEEIKNQTLNSLGRYVTMNQDLGSGAFSGIASLASMRTTEEVASTGRNVSARFDQVIQAMQIGANEYDRIESENQAKLSSVAAQA